MQPARVIILALLLVPVTTNAAKPMPLTVTVTQLTLGTALKIARGAIAACRKKGYQVTATVVNRDGIPQVVLRDTVAAPLSLAISYDKAYTSAMFRAKGTTLQRQPRHAPLAEAGAHLVFAAGSVPVAAGGVFYGAVGVSGTPDATLDEYCAGRGVAAVQEALEMQ